MVEPSNGLGILIHPKKIYGKIFQWSLQDLIKRAPNLEHILLNKAKVIESFAFGVYRCILKNKIDC